MRRLSTLALVCVMWPSSVLATPETEWFDVGTFAPWRINEHGELCQLRFEPGRYRTLTLTIVRADGGVQFYETARKVGGTYTTSTRGVDTFAATCSLPPDVQICSSKYNCHSG